MIATTANGTPAEQRWTHGTPRFVTPANTFDPRRWEVAPLAVPYPRVVVPEG